ncbi:MAG TPA: hypothetical protein VM368_05665, partial [Flavisolibacter sp.]|nr:hypothetical protein [Flavisolibacter sp.]
AEVARLNQNKATLDVRYQELDKELVPLQGMWQNLQQIKSGLDSKVREASLVHEKINVALEQLRRCEQYGKEAAKIAEERGWGTYHYEKDFFGTLKIVPSKNLLNGWAERMKSLASKQWD